MVGLKFYSEVAFRNKKAFVQVFMNGRIKILCTFYKSDTFSSSKVIGSGVFQEEWNHDGTLERGSSQPDFKH
jgi:hypothetical protein